MQRILDAACSLFARQGIRTTTLDQVGELSGTGRGQLYHYFSDKADLVGEVVAQQIQRVLEAQQPLLGTLNTASDVREWCARATEQYGVDDPIRCPIGSLVHELDDHDEPARAVLAAGFARWRALLADGLRRVERRGELNVGADPDTVADALLAAYQGGLLLASPGRDLGILRRSLAAVADGALPHPASA